jgi:hypothetical protein
VVDGQLAVRTPFPERYLALPVDDCLPADAALLGYFGFHSHANPLRLGDLT